MEASGGEKEQEQSSIVSQERATYSRSSINCDLPPPKKKKPSSSLSVQNELLKKACSILESTSKPEKHVPAILMAWGEKLETLEPQQRAFAEKAINDILFEASQGSLHRNSVKINEDYQRATPSPLTSNFSSSGTNSSWPAPQPFYQISNYPDYEENSNRNLQFDMQTQNKHNISTGELRDSPVTSPPPNYLDLPNASRISTSTPNSNFSHSESEGQSNNNMSLNSYYALCSRDLDIN